MWADRVLWNAISLLRTILGVSTRSLVIATQSALGSRVTLLALAQTSVVGLAKRQGLVSVGRRDTVTLLSSRDFADRSRTTACVGTAGTHAHRRDFGTDFCIRANRGVGSAIFRPLLRHRAFGTDVAESGAIGIHALDGVIRACGTTAPARFACGQATHGPVLIGTNHWEFLWTAARIDFAEAVRRTDFPDRTGKVVVAFQTTFCVLYAYALFVCAYFLCRTIGPGFFGRVGRQTNVLFTVFPADKRFWTIRVAGARLGAE